MTKVGITKLEKSGRNDEKSIIGCITGIEDKVKLLKYILLSNKAGEFIPP